MPLPSEITATQVNTEIGAAAGTSASLDAVNIRNLASAPTGQIRFSDLRWGINFPGRRIARSDNVQPGTNQQIYSSSRSIIMSASATNSAVGSSLSNRAANNAIVLHSNGTIEYIATTEIGGVGTFVTNFLRTWLTSGTNADYTANLNLQGGATNGGNVTNSDLPLTGTLSWSRRVLATGTDQLLSGSASGNLIIKSGGEILISRPFSFSVQAYRQGKDVK